MSYPQYSSHSAFYRPDLALIDHRPEWLRLAEQAEELNRKSLGPTSIADLDRYPGAAAAARQLMERQALAASYRPAADLLGAPDWPTAARVIQGLAPVLNAKRFLDEEHLNHQARDAASMYRNQADEMAAKAGLLPDQLRSIANQTAGIHAPGLLDEYRLTGDQLAVRLGLAGAVSAWASSQAHLAEFARGAAYSDLLKATRGIGMDEYNAMRAIASGLVPTFGSARDYSQFLNAAGLDLPRGPRLRWLSPSERNSRKRLMLDAYKQPRYVERSRTLLLQYEGLLRDFIDRMMTDHYGEDWAEQRLKLCGCGDLLRKWKDRSKPVLIHADFAHYGKIMTFPAHFEAVFEAGFDDCEVLGSLIDAARTLRAMLMHGHEFTLEHVRQLKVVWKTLEKGILLVPDYEIEYCG